MKYDKKFGYYDPKTKKAQVYDGSKRTPTKQIKNGVGGFTIAKSIDGTSSKAQFDKSKALDCSRQVPECHPVLC